ncbi:MAG: PAS domain S-box protein, partial [Chloroflexi bacterium]|nr:PAS domain S-box protein [Chloroflexota bacterium]
MIEYRTDTQEFQRSATLIIAAEERLRRQFITIFNDTQFFVLEAPTLNELQDLARSARPDLILLAHGGVPFDSYAACAALHAETETHRVPIVLLIPGEDEVLINRALESGASDYISYPIKSNVMRQRVRFLLRMRHMQADLLEKEERYRIISTSISDYAYAFGVEPDGTLVKLWSTQAFETITGYNELDLDARGGWIALIHPDDIPIAIRRAERLMRGEKDVSEFRIVTRSGETRWLQDTGMPIWDEKQGRVTAIYGAAQDITDRKRAEEMMRNQAEQLRLRNEELDAFAHTVAHNLKNPIAGMMGTASLALNYYDRMTDAERRDNLEA